jgi:hypothetical protein
MSAYDPMTLLTFDQMNNLIAWYRAAESDSFTTENNTISGGNLKISVDHEGVWITPTP